MKKCWFAGIVLLLGGLCNGRAASVITTKLDDPGAVYMDASDGSADDTAALQAAIDKAESRLHEGIVFVPAGRY